MISRSSWVREASAPRVLQLLGDADVFATVIAAGVLARQRVGTPRNAAGRLLRCRPEIGRQRRAGGLCVGLCNVTVDAPPLKLDLGSRV